MALSITFHCHVGPYFHKLALILFAVWLPFCKKNVLNSYSSKNGSIPFKFQVPIAEEWNNIDIFFFFRWCHLIFIQVEKIFLPKPHSFNLNLKKSHRNQIKFWNLNNKNPTFFKHPTKIQLSYPSGTYGNINHSLCQSINGTG